MQPSPPPKVLSLPSPVVPSSVPLWTRASILSACETFAYGAVGAAVFGWLNLPAGFITGPMVFVAIAAIIGRPLEVPQPIAHVASAALGISLGAVASPDLLQKISAYPVSITLLGLSSLFTVAGCALYLRYVHGWTALSALLGATPGALSQMIALAIETNSDRAGIAIVQTLRVVALTMGIPLLLSMFGMSVAIRPGGQMAPADPVSLLFLIAISGACALALRRLRFPGGPMFGAMLGSGLMHGFNIVHGGLPFWLYGFATIMIGAMIGTRFSRISPRMFLHYLSAGFGSMAIAIAITLVFAIATIRLAAVPTNDVVVAFAPGAIDLMMALALTLHLDPIFVGVHHLFRFVGVAVLTPLAARLIAPKDVVAPEDAMAQAARD